MSLDIEPVKSRHHTADTVDAALLLLAINGGNSHKTAEQLKERGIDIGSSTLRDWRNTAYPNRYADIQQRHYTQLEDVLVRNERELALAASRASLEAVQRAQEQLEAGKAPDPARTAQALATTAGIATDKLLTLTGRPTAVVQHQDSSQILKKYGGYIDAEAVELPHGEPTTLGQLSAPSDEPNAHE